MTRSRSERAHLYLSSRLYSVQYTYLWWAFVCPGRLHVGISSVFYELEEITRARGVPEDGAGAAKKSF